MMREVRLRPCLRSLFCTPLWATLLALALTERAAAQPITEAEPPATAAPVSVAPAEITPAATSGTAVVATGPYDDEDGLDWDLANRRYNSWGGPTGGLFLFDPRAAQPGAVRVQLGLDAFRGSDVLRNGDHVEVAGQTLSLSVTATKNFEFYASLANRSTSETEPDALSSDALGDVALGARVGTRLSPVVDVGADLRGTFVNKVGGGGYDWGATSAALRAALSIDLQRLPQPFPLLARFNVGYVLDNSAVVVKDTERARYNALDNPADRSDETEHLVNRFQRVAMGISRLDRIQFGAGVELPLRVAEKFYLHPLVEWTLGLPVNRQGYDCPFMSQASDVGTRKSGEDSCYERSPSSLPMNLALGVRVVPPARGLSALLGVDLGLSGTNKFVRELSPNLPWRVLVGFSYDYDARPVEPKVVVAERPVVAAPVVAIAKPAWRVQGTVVSADGKAVADARIHFPKLQLSTIITETNGLFSSEPLPPGTVDVEVVHPDYEPGHFSAVVTATGGDVLLRCTLVSKPLVGKINGKLLDTSGSPVVNARVIVTGPSNGLLVSDARGDFASGDLAPGAYTLRIEAGGYFIKQLNVQLEPRTTSTLNPPLTRKPIAPSIVFSGDTVETPTLRFASETSSELNAGGAQAMLELADLLLVRSDLYLQIQGFGVTEAVATARAAALRQRLIEAGVTPTHVEAVGGGVGKLRFLLHR